MRCGTSQTGWINDILAIMRSKDQQLLKSIEIEAV
jgi:hypothetical protein